MKDLKRKAIRGGLAKLCAQGVSFVLRVGSLMVLARLLSPKDFGLVGMVTAFTGILTLFRDFGLSSAAIQRTTVTEEQISTLFWINMFLGARTWASSASNGTGCRCLLPRASAVRGDSCFSGGISFQRGRNTTLSTSPTPDAFHRLGSDRRRLLDCGYCLAIAGAKAGYGYWALVAMSITSPFIATIGLWLTAGWVPGMPRQRAGIRSMMHFGGSLTLIGLVVYVAYNAEKIMIGRFWGADAIGIYGRAYQLVNIPTDNLNSAVGEVAFSALSRLQDDPVRFKNYFLKGFSLVLGADAPHYDCLRSFCGRYSFRSSGAKVERCGHDCSLAGSDDCDFCDNQSFGMAALFDRTGSTRLEGRSCLRDDHDCGLTLIALPYGPKGVAFAYSAVMTLWVIPHILWCVHGTPISLCDILVAVSRPLASGIIAGGLAFGVRVICGQFVSPLPRLVLESSVLLAAFFGMLLFVAGQRALYLDLLWGLKASLSDAEK